MFIFLVCVVDINLDFMIEMFLFFIIFFGVKCGIFLVFLKWLFFLRFMDEVRILNRRFFFCFLVIFDRLGMVKMINDYIELVEFFYNFVVVVEWYGVLVLDWVFVFEEIYKMVDYVFIIFIYFQIFMDFDKDVDFWDMRMSILFFNFYCRVIVEVVEIKFGMLVLDIGCGLVFFFFLFWQVCWL